MNIAVLAPSSVPFVWGGLENLVFGLYSHLTERTGHRAELIKIPSPERTLEEIVSSYLAWSQLSFDTFDAVLSVKYPTWMVRHPNHVLWLAHRLRGLYDTYPPELPPLPKRTGRALTRARDALKQAVELAAPNVDAAQLASEVISQAKREDPGLLALPGPLARETVHLLDALALRPDRISRYAAISKVVAGRAHYFPAGSSVQVVYPPCASQGLSPAPAGNYFFTASRLDAPKRMDLVIRAFRKSSTSLPLKIAGRGPEEAKLKRLAAGDSRIQFLGFVGDAELRQNYSRARAVVFAPADEDFGYIALEAQLSGKAVLTTTDSGGPAEMIADGVSGLVVPPSENDLAQAIDRLSADENLANRLGTQALQDAKRIDWKHVCTALFEQLVPRPPAKSNRRSIVAVTVPFPVSPPTGGGKIRIYELYRRLARFLDVKLVCFTLGGSYNKELCPGLTEIAVGASEEHRRLESELSSALAWIPVTDVALPMLLRHTPAYFDAFTSVAAISDLQVVSHPYTATVLMDDGLFSPLIYEAHNVELELKRGVFAEQPDAAPLLEMTEMVEGWCLRSSQATMVCSPHDAELLGKQYALGTEPLHLVPNGVDDEAIPFLAPAQRKGSSSGKLRGVFLGSWHPPNIDAAEFIIALGRKLPHIEFCILGNLKDYFKAHKLPPNVQMMGYVPHDAKMKLFATCHFALNPMRYGSGTNLKMLEYVAAGIPVITTPLALRGLPELAPYCISAPLEEFENLIGSWDTQARTQRVDTEGGRRVIEQQYSWNAIARTAYGLFSSHIA